MGNKRNLTWENQKKSKKVLYITSQHAETLCRTLTLTFPRAVGQLQLTETEDRTRMFVSIKKETEILMVYVPPSSGICYSQVSSPKTASRV